MFSLASKTIPNQANKYNSITPGSIYGVADKAFGFCCLSDFNFIFRDVCNRVHLREQSDKFD